MNKFYIVVALALAACAVKAEEPVTEPVTITVTGPAAKAFVEAEAKRSERMQAAAERAGMGFWETRRADAVKVWGATKWAACQTARGVANADGYIGAAVAVPAGYVAGAAFSGAEACASAAASIK